MPVNYVGPGALAGTDITPAQPVAMVDGDFDHDGVNDLAVGFAGAGGGFIAIHRGNLDAFAPQSEASFQAIAHSQFLSPFLPQAQTFSVPVSPDFIATGDFTGQNNTDLAVASRAGSTVYIFAGDGKGNFKPGPTIALPGAVTSLAGGVLGKIQLFSNLVVGVSSRQQTFLAVYGGGQQGLAPIAAFPLSAPATNINFGEFGDVGPDAAFLSGGQVVLLHSSSMQLETLSLPVNAQAMVLGSFVYDRMPGLQIALLDANGNISIAAHNEFDPRVFTVDEMRSIRQARRNNLPNPLITYPFVATHGWKIVESVPTAASFGSSQPPILLRTRISNQGADDVMVISASAGQMAVFSHPDPVPGTGTLVPGALSTRPYSGSAVAAISARVNIDARPGVLALHQGEMAARVMQPLPDPTFFPNRFDDIAPRGTGVTCLNTTGVDGSGDCTLREAIIKANGDNISLQAGTYTLTIAKVANDCTGKFGALSAEHSVNITGAGQATTIIQAGATQAAGVDMVMNVNEDLNTANCPETSASVSLSSLTLQNGHNNGTHGNDGDGGCMEYDTGLSGNATLSLTNVTLNNCTTIQGNGAGIAIFNFVTPGGTGAVTISNSIIQGNSANDSVSAGTGGGIWVSESSRLTMSNSQVLNNTANNANTDGGGGITTTNRNAPPSPLVTIHASIISGNHSAGSGGGGIHNETNLLVDQGTVISGNTTTSSTNGGGGLYDNTKSPDSVTLTKVTITGNSAPNGLGGGIFHGNNSAGVGGLTMTFSRLAGNSASTAASKNLENDNTTITVTNNWWGTNTPTSTFANENGGATTFDPFIVLTHTASPNKIRINQSSTLTGDMSKDNHGVGTALAGNLDVLNGVAITFNNPVLGTIPQTQPEALDANAQATATYNAGGTGGNGSADATVDQQTVTAPIIVLQPPSITKSFSPTSVATNSPSTITFSITNGNTVAIDSSFTDNLPSNVGVVPGNLVVATTPNVVNGCGGSVTATAGTGSISFANPTLAIGTCTVKVDVQSAVDNVYSNSVTIDSTDAGNGNTSSANLTVINPPSIAKVFGAATVPLGGTTSLTFTLTSSDANLTLNGVAFTDNLPAGLVVATPPNLNDTCGGTATAAAGSGTVSLTGASLPPGASCTVSVNVTGTTAGVKTNSVQVTSTNGGTGNTSSASITVVAPPTISKLFGAASIPLGGSTSLSFTINNPNSTVTLNGIAFSDTLPAGLVISTPNGQTGTCGGGTITATQGTNTITLSGASLAASTSCTFSVNVTGTAAGTQNNTTGNVTSTEGGTGGTASTSITVVAPPSIAKAFNPTTVAVNGTTTLTFTITNPAANTVAETGVAFSDTLPTGLVVSTPNGLINNCGGTATATAGTTGISLTGGSIATTTSCTVIVNVTGTTSGQYTNTTGNVTSTNGGTGNTASANLTVASPPSITKVFGAATIPLNGATTLTFNINNPNTGVVLTGIAFTDSLPAGLLVATPNGLSNNCGGTATAVAGSGSASLSAGTLATSASCTVSLNVTGTTAGVKNNSVKVTSTEGGTGNTSNASITVVGPPTISKLFGAASIPLNGSTSLSFTINNPNTTQSLSGIAFSDTLPAGLVISTPNGQTGTCGGGTITATQGTNVISLSGATLAASTSCTFSVNVTGTAAGTQNNTTGNVTSTEGGTGGTASNSLAVVAPPSIVKAFNPTTIPLNGTTTLTFTITNPAANTVAETGVAFGDTLPTGLVVATPNGLINNCGGTATATAGTTGISLTGGSIATTTSCTVIVNVTGTTSGQYTNTTGSVTSTNGGTGNTASANLTVASPPSITKAFGALSLPQGGTTSLTFNISNPNSGVAFTGLAFTDSLPAGLVVAPTPNLNNTCGGTATGAAGATSVVLSAGTLASGASCTVSVNIQGTSGGVKNNTVQASSNEGGTSAAANASLTVIAAPAITKTFGAPSISLGGSTSLTFNISNPNAAQSLSGIAFSDILPSGLIVSTPNGQTGSCGSGTITATAGTNAISLSGGTLAASGSCSFSVNVTGTAAGTQNNTTSTITSNEGGTGGAASASTVVVAPPTIAKGFTPPGIQPNGVSFLTITITNPAGNSVAEAGVAFTDALPTNLVVATPNGLSNTCGGTASATSGTGTVSLVGGSVGVNSSCTVSANVTSAFTGSYLNTTGAVSSTNGGTGGMASATLAVANPPTISKLFLPATTVQNGTALLSFTITNPNSNSTAPNSDVTLTGISFTDSLPAGLVVASPNALSNSCDGVATAVPGSSAITLTGGDLAPAVGLAPIRARFKAPRLGLSTPSSSGQCFISVKVLATTQGTLNNTTGVISANESGVGAVSNTASLTVTPPPSAPTLAKAFAAATIPANTPTTLTFTMTNPNASTALSNIAFNDILPSGMVVANPNGLPNGCADPNATVTGQVSAVPGSNTISMTSLSLNGAVQCSFSINVVGTSAGAKNNTTTAITAAFDDGTGTSIPVTGLPASATTTVLVPDMTIAKSHTGNFTQGDVGDTYQITVSNTGSAPSSGTVTVTDAVPAFLIPTALSGTGWACTLATATCTRSDALANGSSYPPITFTVSVFVNAPTTITNSVTVSGGGEVNTANDTATDATTINQLPGPPLTIALLVPSTQTIKSGQSAQFVFDVVSHSATLGNINFACAGLPPGSACNFTPQTENQGDAQVTMTMTTTADARLVMPFGTGAGKPGPVYAALLFPVLGLVSLAVAGRRGKKNRMRLVMFLGSVVVLMALFGCGGSPNNGKGTPIGAFPLTVTATSAANPTVTASTQIVVTVQ